MDSKESGEKDEIIGYATGGAIYLCLECVKKGPSWHNRRRKVPAFLIKQLRDAHRGDFYELGRVIRSPSCGRMEHCELCGKEMAGSMELSQSEVDWMTTGLAERNKEEEEYQKLMDKFMWAGLRFVDFRKITQRHVFLLVPMPHEGRIFDVYLYLDRQEAKVANTIQRAYRNWPKFYLKRVSRRDALELKNMANYKRVRYCERLIRGKQDVGG